MFCLLDDCLQLPSQVMIPQLNSLVPCRVIASPALFQQSLPLQVCWLPKVFVSGSPYVYDLQWSSLFSWNMAQNPRPCNFALIWTLLRVSASQNSSWTPRGIFTWAKTLEFSSSAQGKINSRNCDIISQFLESPSISVQLLIFRCGVQSQLHSRMRTAAIRAWDQRWVCGCRCGGHWTIYQPESWPISDPLNQCLSHILCNEGSFTERQFCGNHLHRWSLCYCYKLTLSFL